MSPTLLCRAAALLERQRAALLARDIAALGEVAEALARLLSDEWPNEGASGAGAQPSPTRPPDSAPAFLDSEELARMARQLREQLEINQTLIANEIAIHDHFRTRVIEAATGDAGLFSGVA
jgi:hypothetical protein